MSERPRTSRYGEAYFAAGRVIANRYVIEEAIGEGATCVVYRAKRIGDTEEEDQPVALKVIHRDLSADPKVSARFRRELAILERLVGEHVIRVHEAFEEDGLWMLALEHVEGTTLDRVLTVDPPDLATAVEITLQICAALGAAHAAGIIHRDLKPANVLVANEHGKLAVKVADFGLAKVVHGDKMVTGLTERDMIFGTPEYMAPEQARGDEQIDRRADLYAAGILLYEMLAGQVPFQGRTPMACLTAHMTEPAPPLRAPPDRPAIPAAIVAVVMRALAKDPDDRFPSARAFAEALLHASGRASVVAVEHNADALGDTDLSISAPPPVADRTSDNPETPHAVAITARAGLTPASKTLPSPEDPPPTNTATPTPIPSRAERNGEAIHITARSSARPKPAPPRPIEGERNWLWITIAIIAALAAIGLGFLLGHR